VRLCGLQSQHKLDSNYEVIVVTKNAVTKAQARIPISRWMSFGHLCLVGFDSGTPTPAYVASE